MPLARTLAQATPVLDPDVPLESDDPRYVDFSDVRGGVAVSRLKKLLQRHGSQNQWEHAVFSSHRGAGKSTELKRLARELSERCFPIYVEASTALDPVEFSIEDLLLVLAREIEAVFRTRGTPLPASATKAVENYFSDLIFVDETTRSYLGGIETQAKHQAGIPFFATLMANLTATLKFSSDHRETLRRQLRRYPGALLTHVNSLLKEAGHILREKSSQRLLLLIDNLDRYNPRFMDQLLVASQDVFKSLQCDLILTPPIELILKPQSQSLDLVFRCEQMPTISLRSRDQGYWEFSGNGREKLIEALGKRIDIDRLIPDPEARNLLAAASGGGIREFFRLAQTCTLDAEGDTITVDDLLGTLKRQRSEFRNRIDANNWWPALKAIATTKRMTSDAAQQEVVFQRLAFQYNGDIWYDVHPLVADLLQAGAAKAPGTSSADAVAPSRGARRGRTRKGHS